MSRAISAYTTVVSLVGAVLIIGALTNLPEDWSGLLILIGLAVIAEWANVELLPGSRSRVSVSGTIALAGMLLFGAAGGILTYAASGITTALTTTLQMTDLDQKDQASLLQRTGFNIGIYVISIAVAGLIFFSLGGITEEVVRASNGLPFVVAVATEHFVNIVLLVSVISLQTQKSPIHIWKENFMGAALIAIGGTILGGAALVFGYRYFHFYGVALFFVPALLNRYFYQLYTARKKKSNNDFQNAHQEF